MMLSPDSIRVYLKTVNTPKQRVFSTCWAPFFLAIRRVFLQKNGFIRRKIPRRLSYSRFSDRPYLGASEYESLCGTHRRPVQPDAGHRLRLPADPPAKRKIDCQMDGKRGAELPGQGPVLPAPGHPGGGRDRRRQPGGKACLLPTAPGVPASGGQRPGDEAQAGRKPDSPG